MSVFPAHPPCSDFGSAQNAAIDFNDFWEVKTEFLHAHFEAVNSATLPKEPIDVNFVSVITQVELSVPKPSAVLAEETQRAFFTVTEDFNALTSDE